MQANSVHKLMLLGLIIAVNTVMTHIKITESEALSSQMRQIMSATHQEITALDDHGLLWRLQVFGDDQEREVVCFEGSELCTQKNKSYLRVLVTWKSESIWHSLLIFLIFNSNSTFSLLLLVLKLEIRSFAIQILDSDTL